jgi:hypothetical protein
MAPSNTAHSEVELRISGPDAEALAAELAALVDDEFGTRPPVRPIRSSAPPGEVMRSADPVAVAALVLAVPGALLAASDLARRMEVSQKIGRLLEWARRKTPESTSNRLEIVDGDGRARRLDRVDSAEVIEIAVSVTVRVRREGT